MKILLTGFDPFGGEPVNPAEEAVKIRNEVYYRNAINASFVPASALGAKGTMYGIFINWVFLK